VSACVELFWASLLAFRSRDQLFISQGRWQAEARRHYARLDLPTQAAAFLAPVLDRVRSGLEAISAALPTGTLRIDDDLHLTALPADEEDPQIVKLRSALDRRIGEAQFPEIVPPQIIVPPERVDFTPYWRQPIPPSYFPD
jgi:hypothetical protein